MNIVVLGAGAWGTAMALSAAQHPQAHQVTLWSRSAEQAACMHADRTNQRYLPNIRFPDSLTVATGDDWSWMRQCDLVVIGVPMSALRSILQRLKGCAAPVAWLCKGFESVPLDNSSGCGLLAHEVCAQVDSELAVGVLSGPSFAQEVALRKPSALVAASASAEVCDALVKAFHSPTLRVYTGDDVTGVEVGGAVKNVLAIATGLCDGLALGLNARAALITRGLAEMTRLGVALGAKADTFMGLSGLGDLVLTSTGDLSRNRRVGLLLAQGLQLEDAVRSLGHVAEGVYCARTVMQRAMHLGVDMPITRTVVDLLDGHIQAVDALALLMGREPKLEGS